MYRSLFLFLFVLKCLTGFAQETKNTVLSHLTKGAEYTGSNKDSAYFYLNKTIAQAEKTNQINYVLSGYAYLINANGIYFDLANFKKNLERFETIITDNPQFKNIEYKKHYKNQLLIEKGNYQYKLGNYEKAEHYFLRVYEQLKTIPKKERKQYQIKRIKSILQFLPAIYREKGKYKLAEDYYNTLLDFLKTNRNQLANPESSTALTHIYLAKLFQAQKKYQKSEQFIRKALRFYQSNLGLKHPNSTVLAHHVLVKNYLLQHKPDSALFVLKRIDAKKWIDPENLKFSIDQTQFKARASAQQKKFETALQFYQKALKTTENYYQTEQHSEIAELHKEIGELFADQKQFEKSLSQFQKALSALFKDFKSETFFDNPKPENVLSKLSLIEVLAAKQQALSEAFEAENNLEHLKAANQTAKSIVKTLDALKPEFESKVDFQFLLEESFPAFDQMVQTAFLLNQKTNDRSYLEDAFFYMEKSKAVRLLAAVQNTKANQFAGVPGTLIEKEQQFRAKINHLEKERFKNPGKNASQHALFELKTKFHAFLDQLKINYPKYHRLKFDTHVAHLEEIQTMLAPEEAFLEYYASQNMLYCFLVEKGNIDWWQVPISEGFSKKTLEFRQLLSTPSVSSLEKLHNLGNGIRQKIIPKTSPSISKLTIARSGLLNYIPFETLYNAETKEYLLEKYTVSYANSATLHKEFAREPAGPQPKILAFAPSFSNKETPAEVRAGLGPLLYNKTEVKSLLDYFEGKILLNEQASLQAFEDNSDDYGVLHFATHAIVNDKFPDYSYLAFSPEKDSLSSLLYIKDLYNYNLKADLVVLSACETGIGKLQKGAGMLSLAKGFNYAGASSLVTTQWKINDKSTSSLMDYFYKNLGKGAAKNTALRNAKLEYIASTKDAMLRHPYYWGGFVLTGNTAPITGPSPNYWVWSALAVFLLLLVFLWKKRFH